MFKQDNSTMVDEQRQVERQTAKIVSIKEITSGKYVKQEGWDPNYILSNKGDKISRVNLLGVVVTVPENGQSVFIDDGSAKIEIRTFETKPMFEGITIGDILLIIGRPREYNNEIYVNAEIVKKISNKGWLEYRKKEIALRNATIPDVETPVQTETDMDGQAPPEEVDDIDIVLAKIKELDKGEGCEVDELLKSMPDAEELVEKLLLKGEIFEMSPGKVKVLE